MKEESVSYMKMCDTCAQFCLFVLTRLSGTLEEVKCNMCKKKRPCYTYKITTKGDTRNG